MISGDPAPSASPGAPEPILRRPGSRGIVAYADADPTGIAELLGRLLEENLAAHPERAVLLRRAVVEIRATDAGVGVVLELSPGRVVVRDAAAAEAPLRPELVIAATSAGLLEVVGAPLVAGLPDPRRREGRAVLGAIATRRIRISGLVRHLGTLRRVARLLSVAEG